MKNFTKLLLLIGILGYFNPAAGQWTSIPDFPGNATDGAFSFVINRIAYVGGGVGQNKMFAYDPVTNSWTAKAWPADGKARGWSAAFSFNNKGYIIGGDTSFGGTLEDVQEYDPATNTWTYKGNFPGGKRDGMFAWVLDNKVFIGGGFDGKFILGDFYEYSPSANTWNKLTDLPQQGVLFPSTFIINNKGYLTMWEGGGFFNELWMFDPTTKQWSQKQSCPGTPRGEGVGFALNGKGYAGLGQTGFDKTHKDIYEYDPAMNTWKFVDSFPISNCGWSSAFVVANDVYIGLGTSLPDFQFSKKFYKNRFVSGLSDVHAASLKLYPNPVSDRIFVELGEFSGSTTATVSDCMGKVMFTVNDATEIDVSGLMSGVYFVQVKGADRTYKASFVKE